MQVNRERLLNTFLDLVKIDSPSKKEGKIADYVIDRLKELGLCVTIDEAAKEIEGETGNIIAKLSGNKNGPSLLFGAHLDTVEPGEGVNPLIKDGVIFSDGTTVLGADDKAGAAVILEAVATIKERGIPTGNIEFLFTVAEESGMLGAKNLDYSLISSRMGFVLDGDEQVGAIINHVPSRMDLKIEVIGKGAHAGSEPEKGVDAIQVAATAIARCRLGRIDEETTSNIGLISGGTAVNIVPEKVILEGEIRSRDKAKMARQLESIEEIFKETARNFGAKTEIKTEKSFDGCLIDENEEVVRLAIKSANQCGLFCQLVAAGIGSDMNILNQYGTKSLILGLGIKGAHTKEEHISIQDLGRACEWILSIIKVVS